MIIYNEERDEEIARVDYDGNVEGDDVIVWEIERELQRGFKNKEGEEIEGLSLLVKLMGMYSNRNYSAELEESDLKRAIEEKYTRDEQ